MELGCYGIAVIGGVRVSNAAHVAIGLKLSRPLEEVNDLAKVLLAPGARPRECRAFRRG